MDASSLSPTTRLRAAVIGCGPIGQLHVEAISRSPVGQLIAVCDPDPARREETAARFGTVGFEHLEQLLLTARPDVVTIATPDHLHVEPALAAIAAGCHVFCEKPLATSLEDAHRIVQAAERRGVQLGLDYNRRFAFGYRTARQLLSEGRIGKLQYALLRVSDRTPSAKVARHPLVMFTTLLTHHIDLVRWYGGEVRSIDVQGGPIEADVMRTVRLSLDLPDGALGTIVGSYRDDQTRTSEWLELGGERGTITVEDMTRRVVLSGRDPDQSETFEPSPFEPETFYDSLVCHVHAFLEAIAAGRQPPVTGHDGLAGLKLAAAAMKTLSGA